MTTRKRQAVLVKDIVYVGEPYFNTWINTENGMLSEHSLCVEGDLTDKFESGAVLALKETSKKVPGVGNLMYYWKIITEE